MPEGGSLKVGPVQKVVELQPERKALELQPEREVPSRLEEWAELREEKGLQELGIAPE